MSTNDFTTTIVVDQTPEQVFSAILDPRRWWSGEIVGDTDRLGAVFEYRYKDLHYSTHEITELVPGKKLAWKIVKGEIKHAVDPSEWNGTEVVFEIANKGAKTELRFTHVGLVPTIECYDRCASAWGFYVTESLRRLLETGDGQPNPAGE